MDHAWVGEGDEVFDISMGGRYSVEEYERVFNVSHLKKYNHQELKDMVAKHGDWGPW